jgi:HD-GYP domain-containing protein (c-di-GMP phosphodiesterase class II)
MAKIDELKSEARRAEAEGAFDRATRLYLRAISAAETTDSLPDPGLQVRVGDLEHRQDDPEAALEHYRRAVDLYADQGLLTNAVAVCNKILRVFPDRHGVHARLAELHLDMGLTADARSHVLRFDELVDGVEGDGPGTRPAGSAGAVGHLRSYLDRDPDQEVAVRLAARLEDAEDDEGGLDVLEEVARRRLLDGQSTGALEEKARALDPEADTEAWAAPRLEVEDGGPTGGTDAAADGVPAAAAADDLGETGVLGALADGRAAAGRRPPGRTDEGDGGRDPAQIGVLQTLARLVEHRDLEAERHAERVGELSARVARRLGLPDHEVGLIADAAPLHDLGMVVVPDRVLLKEDELTPEERSIMTSHAANGARILSGSDLPVMRLAAEIARTHHERWDGEGYPRGLEGPEIPVSGRIVAVADAFDALTHERPHRGAASVDDTLEEIRRQRGAQFDPRVVDALLEILEELAGKDAGSGRLLRAL